MEGSESILEAIYENENPEDFQDVDMLDVEEGECVEDNKCIESTEDGGSVEKDQVSSIRNHIHKAKKKNKKKKKKRKHSMSSVTDINWFVIDTCRRLKERKSYLVWNAVGCLGVSAVSDLLKEVDTIQACGGQMTADGKRFRNGGGILWSILKTREPKVYKEIMDKGKEFEKQFKQRNIRQTQERTKGTSQRIASGSYDGIGDQVSDGSQLAPQAQDEVGRCDPKGEHISVMNRIRVPVTYDDLLQEDPKVEST